MYFAGNMYQGVMRDEQLLHGENGIDGSTPLSQVGITSPPSHVRCVFGVMRNSG